MFELLKFYVEYEQVVDEGGKENENRYASYLCHYFGKRGQTARDRREKKTTGIARRDSAVAQTLDPEKTEERASTNA